MSTDSDDLNEVAVIGMAGRFPGADDVEALWELLLDGREGISQFSSDELAESGVDREALRREDYVRAKGVLDGGDTFDAGFFGYSPREAEVIDPQQRVFLECAWSALETAGYDSHTFDGSIGLFAGASMNSYLLFNIMRDPSLVASIGTYQTLLASDKDFLATRVSYKLDLKGPSLTVQTACSTSLTAVHLACQSLLNGECDIAIAGGVSVSVPLRDGYVYEAGGILSPDGHCRAFDAAAAGTVAGNGVGAVVLRRREDAEAACDAIDALILGTAINNDGSLKVGYTAPSVEGQAAVIDEALAVADVHPGSVGYIETHGTGTVLGDPIEVAALTSVFRRHTDAVGYCALGSIKSNIGHLDAAAGVTGLIKAVLALRREVIPPTLHYSSPNPELALDSSPFFVAADPLPWPRQDSEPRRAGVSSFGIGGTNVHVVLGEAPEARTATAEADRDRPETLLLSGKTPAALAGNAELLAHYMEQRPDVDLSDIAHTLACRRPAFQHRRAVTCRGPVEAIDSLLRMTTDAGDAMVGTPTVAFLFPGQGSQHAGMASSIYDAEPDFASAFDRCADLFGPCLDLDLRDLILGRGDDEAGEQLRQTRVTQPALFTVQYALARLLVARGVVPQAMIGHSIGEYAAAQLSGVFSLEDAVRLVAARGRLMNSMPRGSMLALQVSEAEATAWLSPDLTIAAVNSPSSTVVAGSDAAIDDLHRRLGDAGLASRKLVTSHAFHSPSMEAAVAPFVAEFAEVALHPPDIPFCSNVTGTWITDEQATSPAYWGDQLRQPVRFSDAAAEIVTEPTVVSLEVGPGHSLTSLIRQQGGWNPSRRAVTSLPRPDDAGDDHLHFSTSLGDLWAAGVPVDWQTVHRRRPPLRLPTYAFQRQRFWVEPPTGSPARPVASPAASGVEFSTVGWTRLTPSAGQDASSDTIWILLGRELPIGQSLARHLTDQGIHTIDVSAGAGLTRTGERTWSIDPLSSDDYAELLTTAVADHPTSVGRVRIVHLWLLDGVPDGEQASISNASIGRAKSVVFERLLALANGISTSSVSVPVEIDIGCQGVYTVTGTEDLHPEQSLVFGPATVISQEVTGASCRVLDLSGTDLGTADSDAASVLGAMVLRPTESRDLAWRGRYWWARHFDSTSIADGPRSRLRDGGVYLITGGLGGIGLRLAEQIAESADRPVLALMNRSPLPPEGDWAAWFENHDPDDPVSARVRHVQHLRKLGAEVVSIQADVTDRPAVAAAVEGLKAERGGLNGVIHAAGMPSNSLIMTKTTADADEVLGAKTVGTLILDEVCGDDLDFMVLCSSVTSVLGGPGQSDYAAANAFLDAFAQWKRRRSNLEICSIGWDTWRGVGMAATLPGGIGQSPGPSSAEHPLLHRVVRSTETRTTYATTFSTAEHWIVDEHRILDHGLVPGTAYLELVRAAMAARFGDRAISLEDVLFTLPLIVPDGQTRTVYTTIEEHGDGIEFTVRSPFEGDGGAVGWQDHATGSVSLIDHDDKPSAVDLDAVRAGCEATEVLETEADLRSRLKLDRVETQQVRFMFGPRWRCLREIHVGPERLYVTLELDESFEEDLVHYRLHPALLDVVGAAARLHATEVYYLPFSYHRVEVLAGLSPVLHCAVELHPAGRSGETLSCDVHVFDGDGNLLVRVERFTIKRINDLDGLITQIDKAAAATQPADIQPRSTTLDMLAEGMEADGAVAAFARIMSAAELPTNLFVVGRDLDSLHSLAQSITPEQLLREAGDLAPPERSYPRPDLATPYVAPETELEATVASIWQEVLGIDRVGLDDDFFELGGHSLAAVQIGAKLQSRFDVELELRTFFDSPTVAHTVAAIEDGSSAGGTIDPIPLLDRNEAGGGSVDTGDLQDLTDDEVEARLRRLLAEDIGGNEYEDLP